MRQILSKLFNVNESPPLLFLVVIYLIGITTNSLTDTIKEWSGMSAPWITIIGLILFWLVVALLDPVSKYINYLIHSSGELGIDNNGESPERHKGLIVLCSMGENISAEQAIRYHYKGISNEYQESVLKHCWMITGGSASLEAANKLKQKLIDDGFPANLFEFVKMSADEADNPARVYDTIEEIFKTLPEDFNETDVIADYTGGTKSMTAGLVLSYALPERKLQVLKPKKYKDDGTADRTAGSVPRTVDIRFKLKKVSK